MRLSSHTGKTRYRLLAAAALTAVLVVSAVGTPASAAEGVRPTDPGRLAWQAKIAQLSQPSQGCFTADYPALEWQRIACTAPPSYPMTPRPGPRPMVVGNGVDISAQAPSGHIFNAIGSFDNVTNVVSESSPLGGSGPPVANAYSLQLNTEFFVSTACAGSPNPGCRGWEQFIFANNGSSGVAFIQYWLIQYNTACPSGWFTYMIGVSTYCYRNSPGAAPVPNQPITNLANLRVSGSAGPGSDSVTTFVGSTAYSTPGSNAVNAAAGWTIAEFNIFGDGGGGQATFNAGASLTVRTRINYGGTTAPNCVVQGFTGETNNLSFGSPPPAPTPPGPAIIVTENTTNSSAANCAYATAVGDTHEQTFAGLAYDFQASGDFVEAQVGAAFEVQARKVSGAPTWPNASVNSCVGTRMGSTTVAVGLGPKLFVDGTATALGQGTLSLASGVEIRRTGDTYIVTDPTGNSMRAGVNASYIDLAVGLGTWPAKVRGLLGNPGNDVKRLEASDGTQFSVPLPFDTLYHRYGDSWRVPPAVSLLAPCSERTELGNPTKPFFVNDLPPDLRERAQGICVQARAPQALLNNCTLDVVVLGEKAAAAYVDAVIPVLDGNQGQ